MSSAFPKLFYFYCFLLYKGQQNKDCKQINISSIYKDYKIQKKSSECCFVSILSIVSSFCLRSIKVKPNHEGTKANITRGSFLSTICGYAIKRFAIELTYLPGGVKVKGPAGLFS